MSMQALIRPPLAAGGSFLVKPDLGLMIWTLIVFGVTLILLWRIVFPRISEALERRQHAIEESIDHARRSREEADALLAEYRQHLHEAREQAEEIVKRARQTADAHEREARDRAQELAAEGSARAQREIEEATRRGLQELRDQVADLTIMAAEKVTRKALDEADQRRLVDEALQDLDFSTLAASAHERGPEA